MLLQEILQQAMLLQLLPQGLSLLQRDPEVWERSGSGQGWGSGHGSLGDTHAVPWPWLWLGTVSCPLSLLSPITYPPPHCSPADVTLGQGHQAEEQEQLHHGSLWQVADTNGEVPMCQLPQLSSLYTAHGCLASSPDKKGKRPCGSYRNVRRGHQGNVKVMACHPLQWGTRCLGKAQAPGETHPSVLQCHGEAQVDAGLIADMEDETGTN